MRWTNRVEVWGAEPSVERARDCWLTIRIISEEAGGGGPHAAPGALGEGVQTAASGLRCGNAMWGRGGMTFTNEFLPNVTCPGSQLGGVRTKI